MKPGDRVTVLGAYSMMTRKREPDLWTGLEGVVLTTDKDDVLVELVRANGTHCDTVWFNPRRLVPKLPEYSPTTEADAIAACSLRGRNAP